MILYKEGATQAQEDEAHAIIEALDAAYPGHPWAVRVYDGGFFIRHLDFPANWGMNCKHTSRLYSASALKREVIRMAGEWLERANLKRGAWDPESEIRMVEGVPLRWQPLEYRKEQEQKAYEKAIATAEEELRTELRPRAEGEAGNDGLS